MALINTTTTGVLGSTFYGDGQGALTVQRDGVTQGVYGNIPAFSAYTTALQVLSNNTNTKIQYNAEDFDTANCYDTSNYRFTPNVAGYYQINALLYYASASSGYMRSYLYKNGSAWTQGVMVPFTSATGQLLVISQLIYLNGTTDYVEIYGWQSSGGNMNTGSTSRMESNWSGFLAKAV